ncbi:MAG: DUF371 domain-containing protein [Candidatus Thorarchaeota archaeon]
MRSVSFQAFGHPNILSNHKRTMEITKEDDLTRRGNCIVAVKSTLSLADLDNEIREIARNSQTVIKLTMRVGGLIEEVVGRGDPALTYSNPVSMVVRKSSFTCGRTLMINADKSASELDREFVEQLRSRDTVVRCTLTFVNP